MHVLIVRHAPAGDRVSFAATGKPDRFRPLTKEGRRKFERSIPGLKRAAPKPRLIASSPYTRAAQTAGLLARAFRKAELLPLSGLAHGRDPHDVVAWLKRQGPDDTIILVGHEPDLGLLIGLLTTGQTDAPYSLKKGGAALIEFEGTASVGKGRTCWVLTPGLLKKLG